MNPTTPSSSSSSAWELWENAKRVAASRGVFSAGQNRPPKSWFPQQPKQQQPPLSSSTKKRRLSATTTTVDVADADGKENTEESATPQRDYSKRRKTLSALNSGGWKSIVNGNGTKDELETLREENARLREENAMLRRQVEELKGGEKRPVV